MITPTPREHEWVMKHGFDWPFCLICGVVQRRDGQNAPCKGPTKLRDMEAGETPRAEETPLQRDPKLQFALIAQIADEGVKFHAHWSFQGIRARLGLIRIALEDLESIYDRD